MQGLLWQTGAAASFLKNVSKTSFFLRVADTLLSGALFFCFFPENMDQPRISLIPPGFAPVLLWYY